MRRKEWFVFIRCVFWVVYVQVALELYLLSENLVLSFLGRFLVCFLVVVIVDKFYQKGIF